MAAQKKLKSFNVEAGDEEKGSTSPELEAFVAGREDEFKSMIRSPHKTDEEIEKLVDTFVMVEHVVMRVKDALNKKHGTCE